MILAEAISPAIPYTVATTIGGVLVTCIVFLYREIKTTRAEGETRACKYEDRCDTLTKEVVSMRTEIATTKSIREDISNMPEQLDFLHNSVMGVLHSMEGVDDPSESGLMKPKKSPKKDEGQ